MTGFSELSSIHLPSITPPCCFSIPTYSSVSKKPPSEELLPFIWATSCPSVYNLSSASWNFSFTHVALFRSPPLDSSLWSFIPLLTSLVVFLWALSQPHLHTQQGFDMFLLFFLFAASYTCFFFFIIYFSLAVSLVWCPTTQVLERVRRSSEVQRNNNNRMHLAKETLSEFHYSTLDCVYVCVYNVCVCVSAFVQVCLLGIIVALEIEVNLWSCKLPL